MSLNVVSKITVEQTPEEIASLMFHPKRDKLWVTGLREVYPMSSGLYTKGAKIQRIGMFLGKHYDAKLLVTKIEENKAVQLYADEPFEMNINYKLREVDGGTEIQLSISSISDINFNSPMSIISGKVQENLDEDLENLSRRLDEMGDD